MTSQLIFSLYYRSYLHQMHQGLAKVCEVDIVVEEYEVYCEYGRRSGPWVGARWKRGMMRVQRAPTSMHRVKLHAHTSMHRVKR